MNEQPDKIEQKILASEVYEASTPDQSSLEKEDANEEVDEIVKDYLKEELNGKEPATMEEIIANANRLNLEDQEIIESVERLAKNGFLDKMVEGDYIAYSLNPVENYGSERLAQNDDEKDKGYDLAA
ncbi:MAG: hypothetical protein BWY51_00236 [Parcubacteria group bacterium ADurb.Bin316]|nr:MAG: hypothetical protein BWY51_00236 [Parcubacteria group bacterium ADurb.Bin316]HOZ55679.1 hypothetical protein [bacterium]